MLVVSANALLWFQDVSQGGKWLQVKIYKSVYVLCKIVAKEFWCRRGNIQENSDNNQKSKSNMFIITNWGSKGGEGGTGSWANQEISFWPVDTG